MPETKVKTPDGSIITVRHPEGASQEDIFGFASQSYKPQDTATPSQAPQPKKEPFFTPATSWKDALVQALPGVGTGGKLLGHFIGSAVQAPVEALKGFRDIEQAGERGQIPSTKEMIPQALAMTPYGGLKMGTSMMAPAGEQVGLTARIPKPPPAPKPTVTDIPTGIAEVSGKIERGQGPVASPAGEIQTALGERKALAEKLVGVKEQEAQQEIESLKKIVADQQKALQEAVRGSKAAVETPREAGEIVGPEARAAFKARKQETDALYSQALDQPGKFAPGSFQRVGKDIEQELARRDRPILVDERNTPVASRVIQDLNFTNVAEISMRDAYQQWKAINKFYRAASAPEDRRAINAIRESYIQHIENKITEGLFSGDAKVLQDLKRATSAYADFKSAFYPSAAGDDVGFAMRKITQRGATPEEIANMVMGSKNLSSGLPVRLAARLKETLGADSQSYNAVRQIMLRRVGSDPAALTDLANSSLGRQLYSAEEQAAMRGQAQGIRDMEKIIEDLPQMREAERLRTAYETLFSGKDIGGTQGTVFRKVIDGTATPQEVADAVFGAISSKSTGNVVRMIKAIERITGEDGPAMDAIRNGAWQHMIQDITTNPEKTVAALKEFLDGRGRPVSQMIYTPEELAAMRKFQTALAASRTNHRAAEFLQKHLDKILGLLGFATHGPMGAVTGFAAGHVLEKAIPGPGKKFARAYNASPPSPSMPRARPRMNVPPPPITQPQYGGTSE